MMDGRLEQLAQQSADLSEIARKVLEEELSRRGLDATPLKMAPQKTLTAADAVPPAEIPPMSANRDPIDSPELRKLVTIHKFRDLPEALLAKGSLDSAGIQCFLADENMVRMDWFISNLLGGIKLLVAPEDVSAAREMLSQPIPEDFDVEGVGNYQQPQCPKCDSLEVSFEELYKPIAFGSLFVNFPLPVHRKGWICHGCDYASLEDTWGDDRQITSPSN